MIKIYFGKRIIHLTDKKENFYAYFKNRQQLRELTFKFLKGNYSDLYITSQDLNDLFQNFKSLFFYEISAGGLVFNNYKQVLAIKNRNIWQLPKGHVEEGETISEAALREVNEECSINKLTIIKHLPSTFHIYKNNNTYALKQTYWFKMLYKGMAKPKPQLEEGISEAMWVGKDEIKNIKANTYDSLLEIWELT